MSPFTQGFDKTKYNLIKTSHKVTTIKLNNPLGSECAAYVHINKYNIFLSIGNYVNTKRTYSSSAYGLCCRRFGKHLILAITTKQKKNYKTSNLFYRFNPPSMAKYLKVFYYIYT